MTDFKPTPFDQHSACLLQALGFERTAYPASWEDVGDCENGPKLAGGPAYDEWLLGDDFIIVVEGEVVDAGRHQPLPQGWDEIPSALALSEVAA